MPLILAPYTLGSEMGVAAAAPLGGAAYYIRRKRFLVYMLTCLALVLIR